jgi:hypothetical protein
VGQACFTRGGEEEKLSCVAWGCVSSVVSPNASLVASPPDGESAQLEYGSYVSFAIGKPTPRVFNFTSSSRPPRCAESDAGSGGDPDEVAGVPRGTQPVQSQSIIDRSAVELPNCIAQAKRIRKRAVAKAGALDRAEEQRVRRKATKKYQRALKSCRAKSR